MDSLFTEHRDRLTMPGVARFYGVEINRASFANCPFHPDNEPSLKIYDDHYHCFGCGAHGDVTNFVARLFGLSQYEAAKKLDYDFGLYFTNKTYYEHIKSVSNSEIVYKKWLRDAERILNDYLNMLCRQQRLYAPKTSDEPLHSRFVEYLKNKDYYEHIYEQIRYGSDSEKYEAFLKYREILSKLEKYIKQQSVAKPSVKSKII